jgi:uncharacterized protein
MGAWDGCANPPGEPYNPFVSHAFLAALERSGSTSARTGWLPRHLLLEEPQGRLLAAAPCYLKSHSRGEFVFDWGWADAYERAGGRYYPKLQIAVPFTPVTGPRLLSPPGPARHPSPSARRRRRRTVPRLSPRRFTSPFSPKPKRPISARSAGWSAPTPSSTGTTRLSQFSDFLAALSSRKRKNIRKERAAVSAAGIEFEVAHRLRHQGASLGHVSLASTSTPAAANGARPISTEAFFSMIGETMATASCSLWPAGGAGRSPGR